MFLCWMRLLSFWVIFSKVTGAAAAARAAAEHRANLENAAKALENVHQSLEDIGADGVITPEQIAMMNEFVANV